MLSLKRGSSSGNEASGVGRLAPRGLVRAVAGWLPRGWQLPDETWRRRHRGIVATLWLHVPAVFVFGVVRAEGVWHSAFEAAPVAILAIVAGSSMLPRRYRSVAATIGLLTASAVLVHLSEGSIEMHFHFFVMMPLVALYQDWAPFLLAIAYVSAHHGIAGMIDPGSVFNHPAALANPWKWAGIHAFFIAGISIVCLSTWKLLEAALEEARDEARVKSEFLSIMSHEIRTPLTAVIGYAGLLGDTGLTADQRQYTDTIRRSGDRLLTLVNDILDYSKLEAGRLSLDESPFDMLRLVDDTIELVAETAHQRGVTLSSLVENSVPRGAIGDSGRIAQVVLNLVSNAIKFTENGEVDVHVYGRPVGARRHEVTIAVRDTGIGIAEGEAERLFDAFTQAEASTSRRYGGTGLGLPIARQLCDLMGGTIDVESELGEGATFRASFVVGESTPDTKRHDANAIAGLRVLVVGDEHTPDSTIGKYLVRWGVRPRFASSEKALLWARAGMRFDVVFMVRERDGADPFAFAVELRTTMDKTSTHLGLVTSPAAPIAVAGVFDSILFEPLRQSDVYDLLATLEAGPDESEPIGHMPGEQLAATHPLRILVAEDNHVNQKVIVAHLRRLGYEADVVSNGAEAVDAVGVRAFDLVLMDLHMPEVDGLTAAKTIREQYGDAAPRIVALTADATPEAQAECASSGIARSITKPIKESELRSVLMGEPEGPPRERVAS